MARRAALRPATLSAGHALVGLTLVCSATVAGPAWAAPLHPDRDSDVPEPELRYSACDHVAPREVAVLDYTREKLEETLCSASLWLDGLFGKGGDVTAARNSHGELEFSTRYVQGEGYEVDLRVRISIDLPTMENRLSAFIGREPNDDFISGRSESLAFESQFPDLRSDDQWLAGLGFGLPGRYRIKSDFSVGVRGVTNTTVFAKNRLALNAYADQRNLVHLRLIPFWTNDQRGGVTAGMDISRVLKGHRLVRWDTVGTLAETTLGTDWRSSLILYQGLGQRRGIALEAFVLGESERPEPIVEYGPRLILRLPWLGYRLVSELALTYAYTQPDALIPREGQFRGGLSWELPFGSELP